MRYFAGGDALIDGRLEPVDIIVSGSRVVDVVPRVENVPDDVERIDCRGRIVSAGFIDLQCNGAAGVDITAEPQAMASVAEALPRFGVTSFLPTIVTSPDRQRRAAIDALSDSERWPGAVALGLHFEGPMISRHHLGAHPPRHVAVLRTGEVDDWVRSGAVAMVTLAPELPDAHGLISRLVEGGIVVSSGHTAMSPRDLDSARESGLSYATHLFNAMAPFGHRAPGPVGAVLADDAVVAGLICDGIHVDPVAVRMAWNALGSRRTSLVSDASAALGMPYGRLELAGLEIIHDESGVRTVDGVLAGSALPLDRAVRNLIEFTGCSIVDALATVTTTPADVLGLSDRGRIRPGGRADLTILDDEANLFATVVGGATAWIDRPTR